jgi:hypothetical protein
MNEIRQFLFLSRFQRSFVTAILATVFLSGIALIYFAINGKVDAELKTLGIDLLKMSLTGSAAWSAVLLYTSSNSYERVQKETKQFFLTDIPREFRETEIKLGLLQLKSNKVIYRATLANLKPIIFMCRLTQTNIEFLIFLPKEDLNLIDKKYKHNISFWERNAVNVAKYGLTKADWVGGEEKEYFEISAIRPLPGQFIFDAASRSHYASLIFGDAASFLRVQTR